MYKRSVTYLHELTTESYVMLDRLSLRVGGMKSLRSMAQHTLRSMNQESLIVGCTSALLLTVLDQCRLPAQSLYKVRKNLLVLTNLLH